MRLVDVDELIALVNDTRDLVSEMARVTDSKESEQAYLRDVTTYMQVIRMIEGMEIISFEPLEKKVEIAMNMYDQEEEYPNCTVQIWKNSETGERSIGWWKNDD